MDMLTGFLLVNKPRGCTSYDCINRIKKVLVAKKIGHMGTLDPCATGLLVIAIGRQATREMSRLMTLDKQYVATGKLGELTDTLDLTGSVIKTVHSGEITKETLLRAIESLGTEYLQIPPIYSALKYRGEPLYKLARDKCMAGQKLQEVVRQKSRMVQLYDCNLTDFSPPFFTIQTRVSHGTYIRSLINDIACKVGSCATIYALERTKIGPFTITNSLGLDQLATRADIEEHIIAVDDVMRNISDY